MPSSEIRLLLQTLDEAYDHRSWHGTNLRGSVRGLDLATLSWRPAPRRHNIWEITVHAAYWKYVVWRRIRGEKRGSFPLKGSNWFVRPVAGEAHASAWKQDVALLGAMHDQLREAVASLTPRTLAQASPGSDLTTRALVTGIVAHDLYHAGQIQLLERLRQEA
jgi:uncharacterized damage-inducible protein DinB